MMLCIYGLGEPLPGPYVSKKDQQFIKNLDGPSHLKASSGWLNILNYKLGMRELEIQWGKLNGDFNIVESNRNKFRPWLLTKGTATTTYIMPGKPELTVVFMKKMKETEIYGN